MSNYDADDPPINPVSSDLESVSSASFGLPSQIGPYRVKNEIGRGAMGIVYEAVQENPPRIVAVKVMKPGIVSCAALRRFKNESEILALLHHPAIAQVYVTGDYREGDLTIPYFVMEYIVGAQHITDYAKAKGLDTRERLELVARVCDAVHCAHLLGIIHRDLKPRNILVDGSGYLKIIDFGLACSICSEMAATAPGWNAGRMSGSRKYMSPEQVLPKKCDIDAKSDVYALGVILYELLTGQLPYCVPVTPNQEAIRRVICDQVPVRPSTLDKSLRGDVEMIVLKALEKDRDRRYKSAYLLSDDLHRYLEKKAINAHPDSLVYQVQVVARRHRTAFRMGAAIFAIWTSLSIVISCLYVIARDARDAAVAAQAQADAAYLFLEVALAPVSPLEAQRGNVTVMAMLDETAEKIGEADQPLTEARLRRTLGNSYAAHGNYRAAEPHLRTALGIRRRQLLPESREVADSKIDLALCLRDTGQSGEAEPLCREALAIHRKLLGNEHPDVAKSANALGVVLYDLKRYAAAESLLREALAIRRKVFGNEHGDVAQTLDNLAETLRVQRRYDAAEPLLNEALAIRRKVFGNEHLEVAFSLNTLGFFLKSKGEYALAAGMYRQALEIVQKTGNGEQRLGAVLLINLAAALRAYGNDAEAEPLLRQALRVQRTIFPGDHPDIVACLRNLAPIREEKGDYAEADSLYREAITMQRNLYPEGHVEIAAGLNDLATTLLDRGDFANAEPLFREALYVQLRLLRAEDPELANTRANLGGVLNELGKTAEAEALLREAVERFRAAHGENHWHTGVAQSHLGDCLRRQERYEEAERELLGAYHVLVAAWKPHDPRTIKTVERLIALYEAWGAADPTADRAEKVAEWKARLASGS